MRTVILLLNKTGFSVIIFVIFCFCGCTGTTPPKTPCNAIDLSKELKASFVWKQLQIKTEKNRTNNDKEEIEKQIKLTIEDTYKTLTRLAGLKFAHIIFQESDIYIPGDKPQYYGRFSGIVEILQDSDEYPKLPAINSLPLGKALFSVSKLGNDKVELMVITSEITGLKNNGKWLRFKTSNKSH